MKGVAVVGSRTIAVQIAAVVGNVILARLLVPEQLGIVAFGLAFLMFAQFLGDGGLGASLIRRRESPDRIELESILGVQLVVTLALVGVAAMAAPFGRVPAVTAIMVVSLPLAALRTPASIVLERELSYRPLAIAEVTEVVAYYAWAIATVASGWGLWGLATATPLRALVGSATILGLSPGLAVRPRISWATTRPLLGFGARFQALGLVNLLRDQGLNVGTAALGGVATLGLWNLASRVLQIPFLLFTTLWRVSYPAMSRLVSTGQDMKAAVERAVGVTAVVTGLILVPLVGAGPHLIPLIVGDQWGDAQAVIPWASLGLMIGGPVSVATAAFLWAVGDAVVPLRAAILHALAWLAVTFSLLSVLGIAALGVGWLAAAVVDAVVLSRGTRKHMPAQIARTLVPTAAFAVTAAAAGWFVSWTMGDSFASVASGATCGEVAFIGMLTLARRPILVETWSLARLSVSR